MNNFRSISTSIRCSFTKVKQEVHISSSLNQKKNTDNEKEYSVPKKYNSIYHSSSSFLMKDNDCPYFWDGLMNYPSIEELIKTIPDYYPLERTHTTVYLKNMRDVIIPNLRHCFRTLGIQVIMDDADGGGNASLITKEYIDIQLYFWKMQKQQKDNDDTTRIYLELQRRQGDSILYHHYAKKILKAAIAATALTTQDGASKYDDDAVISDEERRCSNKLSSTATKTTTAKIFPIPLIKKNVADLKDINQISSEASKSSLQLCAPSFSYLPLTKIKKKQNNLPTRATSQEEGTTASTIIPSLELSCSIQMMIALLKSKKLDSQILGMKSLCILTDPSKTNRSIAYLVSHEIIFGKGKDSFIHALLFKLILLLQQEPQNEKRTSQSLLENRDVDDDYDSDYNYGDDDNENYNYDHVTYLFQQHDDDDDNGNDDHSYDIKKLLPNSLGCSRKNYHRSVVILRNYALTVVSNAWEVLRQDIITNDKEKNNKNDNGEGREEKDTVTIYPQFSSAVILTATKIINRNDSKMKSQHHRSKEYYSDNDISNDTVIDLIIQNLWKDIAFVNKQPHNACLAIKCLLCLSRCYCKENNLSLGEEKRHILQRAEMIGKATNERLETLCQELLHQTA